MAASESAANNEPGNRNISTQLTIPRNADLSIPHSVINCFGDLVPNRTLLSCCQSMPFVLKKPFPGGKRIWHSIVLSALRRRFCSMPTLDRSPPDQPQPLVRTSLGPLPVSPPTCSELRTIASRCHRERLPTNFAAENAQRSAGVELGCDNQDPAASFARQAFFHVVRFLPGRKPLDRTDADRRRLRKSSNVFLGQLELRRLVDLSRCGNVDQHPAAIALIQQLQRASGPTIRLTRQNQNHVGWLRRVYHQHPACICRKGHQDRGQQDCGQPDSSSSFRQLTQSPEISESAFPASLLALARETPWLCVLRLRVFMLLI